MSEMTTDPRSCHGGAGRWRLVSKGAYVLMRDHENTKRVKDDGRLLQSALRGEDEGFGLGIVLLSYNLS